MGMAIAGRWLAGRYNRDEMKLFDFDVCALAGDGGMMEGVTAPLRTDTCPADPAVPGTS